jgi:RNA-directed DNA polymerase
MTWSPQQYFDDGLAAGIDPTILEHAIAEIEQVIVPHPELPALLTLNHLAERTGTRYSTLRSAVITSEGFYRHFRIRKRSGGHRVISVPDPTLMSVHRWIAAYILNPQQVHHFSFAFKPEASILKCAARHVGAKWLIKMDVAGFFGSISEIQVYRVFRSLGYQPLISFELARLTTHAPIVSDRYQSPEWRAKPHPSPIRSYNRDRLGYLPQGAPTSPMLSNLIMRHADAEIEALAKVAGVHYTRYSDDLTFSTRDDFDRARATRLVWKVSAALRRTGLKANPRKTTIVPPGGRKIVLGLLVDRATPRLSRDFRSMLRQHLYYLERLGPFEHTKKRGFDTVSGMYRHVRGLIDFANMVEPTYARKMLSRFNTVEWPISFTASRA